MKSFTPKQIDWYINKTENEKRDEFQFLKSLVDEYDVKIMAEIGLWKGTLSEFILQNCSQIQEYWGIDAWQYHPSTDNQMDPYYQEISNSQWNSVAFKTYSLTNKYKKFHVVRLLSYLAANLFPDNYFDCVFIDADHSYEGVLQDISNWAPKLKPTGILCGDDFHRKSVKQAINDSSFIEHTKEYKKYWMSI